MNPQEVAVGGVGVNGFSQTRAVEVGVAGPQTRKGGLHRGRVLKDGKINDVLNGDSF